MSGMNELCVPDYHSHKDALYRNYMKISRGLKKKPCMLSGNRIITDSTSQLIEQLHRQKPYSAWRYYAIAMLIPSSLLALYVCYLMIKDYAAGPATPAELYETIASCGLIISAIALAVWAVGDTFRYQSRWILNDKETIYVETGDDSEIETKLDSIVQSIKEVRLKEHILSVRCPYCHEVIDTPSYGEYSCQRCKTTFTFNGNAELINVRDPHLIDNCITAVWILGLFALIPGKSAHIGSIAWYSIMIGAALISIASLGKIYRGFQTGVIEIPAQLSNISYRAETPGWFYGYIIFFISMTVAVGYITYFATAEHYYEQGLEILKDGNYEKALQLIDKAIEMDSRESKFYVERAGIRMANEEYREALDDFDRAITISTKNELIFFERGLAHFKIGDMQKALSDFEKVVELDPRSDSGYLNRAIILYDLGNKRAAFKDMELAAKLGNSRAKDILQDRKIRWN